LWNWHTAHHGINDQRRREERMRSVVVGGLNFELFSKRLETVPFPNLNSVY
jgi:hypothetical protein